MRTTKIRKRHLVVCNKAYHRQNDNYVLYPIIALKGKWLYDAGFRAGQLIEVQCEEGRLTIRTTGLRRDD